MMIKKIKRYKAILSGIVHSVGKEKIFCIGRNKTGTTTLKTEFKDLGFHVGDQLLAEKISDREYFSGDCKRLIAYCYTAQVFQDRPFSYPDTFRLLDRYFPGAKFILTVRDSDEQWYNSMVNFHAKKFGKNGMPPTAEELESIKYRTGNPPNVMRLYGTSRDDPYNRKILTNSYNKHNENVREYFRNRPDDLLEINVSNKSDYGRFLEFIGAESDRDDFFWKNKT